MMRLLTFNILLLLVGCATPLIVTEDQKQLARDAGSPVYIEGIWGTRNSAAGIDLSLAYHNVASEPFKYATFEIELINDVGDVVKGQIRRQERTLLQVVGPVELSNRDTAFWEAPVYHSNASKVRIVAVEVEFFDGATQRVILSGIPNLVGRIGEASYSGY